MRLPAVALAVLLAACSDPAGQPGAGPAPPAPSPEAGSPSPTTRLRDVRVRLVRIAVLEQPLAMAVRPDDPALYVAEKTGRVVAVEGDGVRTVLDLRGQVSLGSEQGLLGLAFPPEGDLLYVNYTDLRGDTHVTEFRMEGGTAAMGSRRDVLVVDQPYSNHNGGHIAFGPDGYLYIGLGDGGSAGDPQDNAQSLGTLLGTMLRIDPGRADGRPYTVPDDNPFVGREGTRPEIWAYGLRNPWRWSFDRETGDLWIGDVGQGDREEIDFQPASSSGGENYGWDGYEGTLVFEEPVPEDAVPPLYEYGRDLGASVIGGFVYRGSDIEGLQGHYLFADFYEPEVRVLRLRDGRAMGHRDLGIDVPSIASFGEDAEGELYVLSLAGPVYRLAPAS
jgi:glucose/arabinose dehydrogenase